MPIKATYEELETRVRELETRESLRRRSEEILRNSEETARALLNATSDSAILIDTEGKIIAINEIAVYRLGKTDSKVVRMNLFDMLPPDIGEEKKRYWATFLNPFLHPNRRYRAWGWPFQSGLSNCTAVNCP